MPTTSGGRPPTELEARPPDPVEASWLRRIWRVLSLPHLGLPLGVDPAIVEQSGWAIVFHADESDAVKQALEPLIAHRRTRVGADRCKVLEYREGEARGPWLARHGSSAGSVDPLKVPYYVLLVGGPKRFPFQFCHQLDVEYAVGCLQFDTAAEYERYARSIVDYETSASVRTGREALFFGTRHDPATELSADRLVGPLSTAALPEFRKSVLLADTAIKAALVDALTPGGGRHSPAIAFTASHGMGWKTPNPQQPTLQGALICQDWEPFTKPGPSDWLSASDVAADANVHGLISFHFACYGVGTPSHDRFMHKRGQAPTEIAAQPFLAALPKALLAHPNGSALACIGHVERAWGYSIVTPNAGAQLLPFQNALARIGTGEPVGHAVKDFNERYAALSTSLSSILEQASFGAYVDDRELASAWIERNDAEGYLVLGDPAVALRVNDMS